MEAIQARHREGLPLAGAGRENRSLAYAAGQHFGGWGQAVAAAGIPDGWQHKWNRRRVIEALQAYGGAGHLPCNREIPNPVRMAAFVFFGTWHKALIAAGLASPESRPATRTKRTKAQILAEIRRQSSPGLPMKITHNLAFATAARKRFGSWHGALLAAGVDPVPWRLWSPERVLEEVRAWHDRGARVESGRREYYRLVTAARARFGSWRTALISAGVRHPDEYRKWERKWTKQSIIEAIQDRRVRGLSLAGQHDSNLVAAAIRRFGSWHAAIRGAGLPARKNNRPARKWSQQKVLEEIRMRRDQGMGMICVKRTDSGLEAAARKLFGSWRAALVAAEEVP